MPALRGRAQRPPHSSLASNPSSSSETIRNLLLLITAGPIVKLFAWGEWTAARTHGPWHPPLLLFITTVPSTKLFVWGEGDSGGHVLRETTRLAVACAVAAVDVYCCSTYYKAVRVGGGG
jgi:hypothetical protein